MGFDWAYRTGTPAWDIGRAQPVVERLAEAGAFAGSVIDVGCGTGENALYLAARGFEVTGVDAAPTAIARAQEKAAARGLSATFLVADALALPDLGQTFDAALDCGLFHVLSDVQRVQFTNLRAVLVPYLLYGGLPAPSDDSQTAGSRRDPAAHPPPLGRRRAAG